ncbi:RodZ domain-containing protein [Marinomonas transparens]|uniref:Helix-turn-helix domain-containing protein n=1 Tax=Marinomonas transparens TaxID=2795388 RepID=A0A934N7L6_9GAMM|nr:RodZ domain-containing protein [Marinomonas transparens]MBJ7539186.1 helix-turn-helix domain-containing protein [Marinomonas transparens]
MTTELQTDAPENVIDVSDNIADAPENTTSVEKINVGERLKAKRIELGFDERRVANELKITIEQVRALEANNFSYFRSVTFSRGFLKSYCRLLELDAAEIINAFDNEQMAVEPTIKPINKVNRQTHLGDPIIIVISVVIVAVLIFLAFWWPATSIDGVTTVAKHDVVEVTEPAATATEAGPPEALEAPIVDSVSSETNASASEELVSTPKSILEIETATAEAPQVTSSTNDVVTGLSAETKAIFEDAGVNVDDVVRATEEAETKGVVLAPQEPAYGDDIVIAFDADCWSEIRDSTGKILYSGVKSAGTRLELTGIAPYRVVLGFAKGVSSLQYKGKAFDFSSFTRQDLARFELK